MDQRSTSTTNGSHRASRETPLRSPTGSTSEAIVAVARDTLDVATELVRDSVSLARYEAERALRDVTPRIAWGAVAMVCAATASVCLIVAIMIGLGSVIPSIAWRLVLLSAVLFLVTFFGSVRAIRPEARMAGMPATSKEEATPEGPSSETLTSRRSERLTSTILPPPNA